MPKIKPEGDPGTKTVMVTVEPGLSKEQIEKSVKALPEIKEEGPDYNVIEALREVTLNASITEAEEEKNKREETKMAEATAEKTQVNTKEEFEKIKEYADEFVKANMREIAKLEKEAKSEQGLVDRIKENWDLLLGTAVVIAAVYFAYKNIFSSNDSMAHEAVMSGLELALSDD